MKRTGWRSLVISSVLLVASAARAESRPRYGGTLRVAMSAAPASLEPAALAKSETGRDVARLLYETLVGMDSRGNVRPLVASAWEPELSGQRWRFQLRPGMTWHGGAPVTAESVAGALRSANSDWTVRAEAGAVVIENATPIPDLLADLTLPRYALIRRQGEKIAGTGPFAVQDWQPGRSLLLAANEGYWGGRPFLDAVRVDMGQNERQQMVAFELGKTDVIELSPDLAGRTQAKHVKSAPVELMALVFEREPATQAEADLRRAFALSLDRESLHRILLQGEGEIAGGLLPAWLTGYEFLFSSERNLQRARQLRAGLKPASPLRVSCEASDALAQLVVQRLALNAREAGIAVQVIPGASEADARLARLRVLSPDARVALRELSAMLNLPAPLIGRGSLEEIYRAEAAVIESGRVLPLLYRSQAFALGPEVRNWNEESLGEWRLSDVWIAGARP